MIVTVPTLRRRLLVATLLLIAAAVIAGVRPAAAAQTKAPQPETQRRAAPEAGGEANLIVPDLSVVDFRGVNGRTLLTGGLVICALGFAFGLFVFTQLKNLPVHQ